MKQISKKPKIAILTLHPHNGGGVLSLIKVVHKFCQNYFEPKLFFLGFDLKISTSFKKLKFFSKIRKTNYFGFDSVEVGARYAFWEPGHYKFTKSKWKKVLKDYDYFFVASGTCIAAHPLTLLDKKFAVWLASTFDEDRTERVKKLSGTRKIIDKYASKRMRIIEKDILSKANFTFALSNYTKKMIEDVLKYKPDNVATCNFPMMSADLKETLRSLDKARDQGERVEEGKKIPPLALSPSFVEGSKGNPKKNIIAVGRFDDPRKNLEMLVRVFDKLDSIYPGLKLNIIGPKPSFDPSTGSGLRMIGAGFQKYKSFKNINFTGLISDEELKKYYNSARLMLITSYQEGLGIVGLEALSNGVPVVATNCGGVSDFIVNEKNGFLVDINDFDGMTAKAALILRSEKLTKEMSEFAIKFVDQNFSEQKIYSIFKYGLSKTYPELIEWFEKCDLGMFKAAEIEEIKEKRVDEVIEGQTETL